MNIEELVKKHLDRNGWRTAKALRAALTEQACLHHIELRAYEATVQNLEQRIRELEAKENESK